jgi:hypothetical protein
MVTSFTFSAEQLRSAPPEVRQWVQEEIASALLSVAKQHPEAGEHSGSLAACTPEEAVHVFEMIRGDFAAAQVFLELALASPIPGNNLYALDIGHVLRRTRLSEDRLIDCFRTIGGAFQQVRRDPGAALLGFDQKNHVFIDAATSHSIRQLWQQLVAMRGPIPKVSEAVPRPSNGFIPPQVGPSESVAEHRRAAD